MMLEKHWQAPKKKTKAQSHKILAGTKKSKKDKKPQKKQKKKQKKQRFPIYGGPESWVDAGILLFFFFRFFASDTDSGITD